MTDAVVYEQFDQAAQPAGGEADGDLDTDLRRLNDVPMELSVEIGRTRMTVGETLQLRAGSIVTLDRLAGEPVDLLVNGTPIARGEVVVVDEQFGLRVTEIVEGDLVPLPDPTGGVPAESQVAGSRAADPSALASDPSAAASGPPIADPPAPDLPTSEPPAQD
jgi:flagellar motor switch protein FliN